MRARQRFSTMAGRFEPGARRTSIDGDVYDDDENRVSRGLHHARVPGLRLRDSALLLWRLI